MNWRRLVALSFFVTLVVAGSFDSGRWVVASELPEARIHSLVVTHADDGTTIVVCVGDRFLLQLGEEFASFRRRVEDLDRLRSSADLLRAKCGAAAKKS